MSNFLMRTLQVVLVAALGFISVVTLFVTVNHENDKPFEGFEFKNSIVHYGIPILSILFAIFVLFIYIYILSRISLKHGKVVSLTLVSIFTIIVSILPLSAQNGDGDALLASLTGAFPILPYLNDFPFQSGFLLLLRFIFKISFGNIILTTIIVKLLISVVSIVGLVFLYKTVELIFPSQRIRKVMLCITTFCLVPLLYGGVVYGITFIMPAATICTFILAKSYKNGVSVKSAIVMALVLSFGICLKPNVLLVYISVLCTLIYFLLAKSIKLKQLLITVALIAVCYFVITPLPKMFFEHQYNQTLGNEGPGVYSWLCTGTNTLNSSIYGPGQIGSSCRTNPEDDVKRRIKVGMEDPIYAITMLAFKDGYAWSQPDFAYGIPQLYRSGGGFVESVGKDVFIGNTNKATFFFLDGYTSLVFFSALFGVFYLRKYPQLLCLPILFAAGFVYHSLFEINSVYMYPYFSILPTLSLVGLYEFYQKFHDRWHMIAQKCLRRVKGVRLLKD